MVISIGCDHAGFELKEKVKEWLKQGDYSVSDEGTFDSESCDYPDFAVRVAQAVSSGRSTRGILICGTGIGMAIAANKLPGISAALCYSIETALLSRQHNDANVLTVGARTMKIELVLGIVEAWLQTDFEEGRHARRVKKTSQLGKKEKTTDD